MRSENALQPEGFYASFPKEKKVLAFIPPKKQRVTRKTESPVTLPVFPLNPPFFPHPTGPSKRQSSPPREKSRFHVGKYHFVEVIWVYSRDPSLLPPSFRCHQCLPQASHWDPGQASQLQLTTRALVRGY